MPVACRDKARRRVLAQQRKTLPRSNLYRLGYWRRVLPNLAVGSCLGLNRDFRFRNCGGDVEPKNEKLTS